MPIPLFRKIVTFSIFCIFSSAFASHDSSLSHAGVGGHHRKFTFDLTGILASDVAKAISSIAPGVASHHEGSLHDVTALSILGHALELASDVQRKFISKVHTQEHERCDVIEEQEFKGCYYCMRSKTRSFSPHSDKLAPLMELINRTAMLKGVTDGSTLWLFRTGVVRAQQEVLLRQIISDVSGCKLLMNEVFGVLREQSAKEIQHLVHKKDITTDFSQVCRTFESVFGEDLWAGAFGLSFNFILDMSENLLTVYAGILNEQIHAEALCDQALAANEDCLSILTHPHDLAIAA